MKQFLIEVVILVVSQILAWGLGYLLRLIT